MIIYIYLYYSYYYPFARDDCNRHHSHPGDNKTEKQNRIKLK